MSKTVTHHPATTTIDVYERSATTLRGHYVRTVEACADHLVDTVTAIRAEGHLTYARALPASGQWTCHAGEPGDEQTDRQLLASVSRWVRSNDWRPYWCGWINARTETAATVKVDWDETAVRVWRKDAGEPTYRWGAADDYPVTSVRQAVDILVDLGILPDTLHSLHSQVATVDELTAEIKRLRTKLDGPCGSCHPCINWADETWRRADRKPPAVITWDDTQEELRRLRAENNKLNMQVRLEQCRADRYQRRADEELSTIRERLAEVPVWTSGSGAWVMPADDVRAAVGLPPVETPTETAGGAR